MARAIVENGKILESNSAASIANSEKKTSNSTVSKDQFLQLLVAQMKYQDPLEPTSNTEYISQYATFSELEQMQNMSASLELARASQLVGHTVIMKVTSESGNTTWAQGNVDYVLYENNKAFLSINGELYSLDDLDTVADPTYLDAYALAEDWINAYNKLPVLPLLTLDDKESVESLNKVYQEMTEYQKRFITDDYVTGLKKYVEKMEELKLAVKKDEETEETDDTDKTDDKDEITDDDKKTDTE